VFRQFHESGIALVEVVPNRLGLAGTAELLQLRTLDVHVALLESLSKSPVEDVTSVCLNDFFNTIDVPVCAIRFEVGLSACVLPDWDCYVIHPLLLEPETHSGNKSRCVRFVLALFIEERVGVL